MDLAAINERIARVHRGKKWILTPDASVSAFSLVGQLEEWGSGPVMIVASIEGVGEVPAVDRIHYTRATGDTVMAGIRAFIESIENPSAELMAAVNAFDSGGEAMVLPTSFSRASTLLDRPLYGGRPAEWGALEDKMLIDELADAAGITRAPSEIVAVAEGRAAAARLAGEMGTVWVADNTEGWHGGGEYVRWIRDPEDVQPAVDWFSEHAERVRVMPFLEGIPCSIHGFNTGDGTAVFLPVEMIIFRHGELPEFVYGRAANFWVPPDVIQEEMRLAARNIGALLAERVGYLGGFGIDGVATAQGFRPTELNPRLSVGHFIQIGAADLNPGTLERLLIAGDLDLAAEELESTVMAAAEAGRGGGMLLTVPDDHEQAKVGVLFTEDGAVAVDVEEPNDATLEIGPGAYRSIVIMRLDSQRNPVGPPIAPRALQAVDLARELWEIDVPPMVVAPNPF